jgi:hypothetical protein
MKNWPWYIKNPTLIQQIKDDIAKNFPMMITHVKDGVVYIKGNLQLFDNKQSKMVDQFAIEIELPRTYPKGLPVVKELNGRIPKIANRHVYINGGLCLFLPDEKWKYYPDGMSIVDFIKGPVSYYLFEQLYYEKEGKFPKGERSHGGKGVIESYSEMLQTEDLEIIKTFILYLSRERAKGHWLCYCKSGKKIRNCHISQLIEYRNKIDPRTAKNSLAHIVKDRI